MASKKASEDELWVKSCLAGNKEAFDLLVKKYRDAVYGVAFHYVGNFTEAKDLVQEAFVQAYINLPRLREPRKFGSWLYGITSNLSKMWLRNAKRNISLEEAKCSADVEDPSVNLLKRTERRELKKQLKRALDCLSDNNRLAVTLYYIDGYSYREIADFLDVPVTTVEGRLHRARRRLKKELLPMVEETFKQHKLPGDFAQKLTQCVRDMGRKSTWKVRLRAMNELKKAGIDAVEALLRGMDDSDWHVRRWCSYVSGDIAENKKIVKKLMELVNDPNKRVRIHAMAALCKNHESIGCDVVSIILRKLEDRNQYVRRSAAAALGYISKDRSAIDPLLKKLNDESKHVRRWAAESLRSIVDHLEQD